MPSPDPDAAPRLPICEHKVTERIGWHGGVPVYECRRCLAIIVYECESCDITLRSDEKIGKRMGDQNGFYCSDPACPLMRSDDGSAKCRNSELDRGVSEDSDNLTQGEPLSKYRRNIPTAATNLYVDPLRDTLRELLRQAIEWAERPVADQDDAALWLYWLQRSKEAVDAAS